MSLKGLSEPFFTEEALAENAKLFPPNRLPGERILGTSFIRENVVRPLNFKGDAGSFDIGISRIVEPGFFAVLKKHKLRKKILLALHTELYLYHNSQSHLFKGQTPILTNNQTTYFTYGDQASANLYEPLGFTAQATNHSFFPYNISASPKSLAEGFLKLPESRQIPDRDWQDTIDYINESQVPSYDLWSIEDF
jgi:hypothetical protein